MTQISRREPRASTPGGCWSKARSTKPSRRFALRCWRAGPNASRKDPAAKRLPFQRCKRPMLSNSEYLAALPEVNFPVCGRLVRSVGLLLESTGPDLPVGTLVKVRDRGTDLVCQVVGFQNERLQMLA